MIYLIRGDEHERAICETEGKAQALEAQGWRRATAAEHAERWGRADAASLIRMAGERREAPLPPSEPSTGGAMVEVGKPARVYRVGNWTIPERYLPSGFFD